MRESSPAQVGMCQIVRCLLQAHSGCKSSTLFNFVCLHANLLLCYFFLSVESNAGRPTSGLLSVTDARPGHSDGWVGYKQPCVLHSHMVRE